MSGDIDDRILVKANEHWGIISRYEMLQEECMELASAVHKILTRQDRSKRQMENFCDEIADVKIMIRSIELCSPELTESISKRIDFKMNRVSQRIDNNEPH